LLSSKKKKRLLGSNKKPPLSAQNPEDFLQDLRDLELLGSHQIHLPLPAISDPEIETALKDLMAASWDELPHSLVEEAKKAVSKATDDVAGQEALKNVFRAAEACKEFGGVLVTLRVALDRYCGLTGLVSGPMPGFVKDAVRFTSDRYMTYLKSFRPDEIYLLRKVETELRKKVIHLRMRCSFIRREWLALTLYGMPPDS